MQGKISIETLYKICEGEEVSDVETDGYWYDSTNMEDPGKSLRTCMTNL